MDPRVASTAADNNWLAYKKNKALLDHTSQALCTPITPGSDGMSVLLLHDVICSERITMHCQLGGNPSKVPLPLGISSPCRRRTEPRPQATRTKNFAKIARTVSEISVGQTLLITVLGKWIRYAGKQHAEQPVYAWFSATVFTILTPAAKKTSTAAVIRQEDSKVL